MHVNHLNLAACTPERLLVLRVLRPELGAAINRELERRGDLVRYGAVPLPVQEPRLKRVA